MNEETVERSSNMSATDEEFDNKDELCPRVGIHLQKSTNESACKYDETDRKLSWNSRPIEKESMLSAVVKNTPRVERDGGDASTGCKIKSEVKFMSNACEDKRLKVQQKFVNLETKNNTGQSADQTVMESNDRSSTNTSRRQLEDALMALNITRAHADKMRNRLHSCSSTLKEQTDDLRISSRALSSALDKVEEYKKKWQEEISLKEGVLRKIKNQESRARFLQNLETDLKLFQRGYEKLGELFECKLSLQNINESSTFMWNKVKNLLNFVDHVQVAASLAATAHELQLKERTEAFEREKCVWQNLLKNKDEVCEARMIRLRYENNKLKEELNAAHETVEQTRDLHRREKDESEEIFKNDAYKIGMLGCISKQNYNLLSQSHSSMKVLYEKNTKICQSMEKENADLRVDMKRIESLLIQMTNEFKPGNIQKQDKSIECNVPIMQYDEIKKQKHDLMKENENMKQSLTNVRKEFVRKNNTYNRMYSNFQRLKSAYHQQELTFQHLQADNSALRKFIERKDQGASDTNRELSLRQTVDNENPVCKRQPLTVPCDKIVGESATTNLDNRDGTLEKLELSSIKSCLLKKGSRSITDISEEKTKPVENFATSTPVKRTLKQNLKPRTVPAICPSIDSDRSETSARRRRSESAVEQTINETRYTDDKRPTGKKDKNSRSVFNRKTVQSCDEDIHVTGSNIIKDYDLNRKPGNFGMICSPILDRPKNRLVGIPMSEQEFQRLVGSKNEDNSTLKDDGYHTLSDTDHEMKSAHASMSNTRNNSNSFSLISSAPELKDKISRRINRTPKIPHKNISDQYLVTYRGVTFDVASFNITQMRHISWNEGFSESQEEMHKFIDFLAEVALELDHDPDWCKRHSLGKSSDWLELKHLL
uniref:rootletin-like n=1 Tax=Styela clava TaxID=7725 RepID=UPI00193ACD45|nr:rootletin-like [Styela clava]XP_039259738.1 rootletin-like [Styela clava]